MEWKKVLRIYHGAVKKKKKKNPCPMCDYRIRKSDCTEVHELLK